MKILLAALTLAAIWWAPLCSAASVGEPLYRVTKTVPLGAPDRWDYVVFDPASGRVYVAHGDRVTVVDGGTGALIGNVEGMPGGTHGVAFAAGKGYTDDGKAGTATVFDPKTLKLIKTVKAEPDADGVVYDPASRHVIVIDGDSGKLTVIDPKDDVVVATIDGGGGLEFGVSGENGKFYADGAEKNELVRVDTLTNSVDAHWPLNGCVRPHGLAIDRQTHRLFVSCVNKVMVVVNADTGALVASLPIGEGTDFAEFDPVRKWALSSNRDGTLSVIAEKSADSFEAMPPVQTAFGARTIAVDPKSGRLYLVTGDFAVNEAVPATDPRHRYTVKPGSAKLLILDPTTGTQH
jgi:DNA-binding beta-propeller fold protein YncE